MAADSYNVHVNSPDTSDYSIYCDIKVRIQQRNYLKSVAINDICIMFKGTPWDETFSMLSILKI